MITINLSFFNQNEILIKHIETWINYPDEIRNKFNFIIIDDHSNNNPVDILKNLNLNLNNINLNIYRVNDNLICNIAGVRNLGAKECTTEWMVILDMDTLIDNKMAEQIINLAENNEGSNVYKFNRKVLNNKNHIKNNKMHPAICLIKKKDYWNIGGCEETLVGNYGYTDPCFWHRAKNKVNIIYKKDIYLTYLPEGEATINRNKNINKKKMNELIKNNNWSTNYINFNWSKIY